MKMNSRIVWIAFLLLTVSFNSSAQKVERPKLVIGMMLDQMRWDYLYRFNDRYTNGGFRRLVNQGHSCENTFIPYTPTYTAVGHTTVYTGSVPALHGIVGNNWFNRIENRGYYCAEDASVSSVGSTSGAGKMSPKNMLTTTVTDELRLATNFQSKTIGIALKDRGAILPAGHTANAAYWFDNSVGGWISSTYYMNELPEWLKTLNGKKLPDQYMNKDWNTLFPIESYTLSAKDDNPYEGNIGGDGRVFPHKTSAIPEKQRYESFKTTPYGNTFTFDMAKAAIEGEQLGQRGVTDFLAVSFSSTDYIGHTFGPNSIEIEDTYLRFDRELEAFLNHLDKTIGKGQYLLFLTADHAVAHAPGFMKDNKIPAGAISDSQLKRWINTEIENQLNVKDAISTLTNYQLFLNPKVTATLSPTQNEDLRTTIINKLITHPQITTAFDLRKLDAIPLPEKVRKMVVNGYNSKLSGDIQIILHPQVLGGSSTGSTHGAWSPYDAHIPLVWFGWKVKPGYTNRETYMTDIAPTVAAMLRIQMPNGSIGDVIEEIIKK